MNIHKSDPDFKAFSAQMGEWIADGDLHYLDLTDQWERFGEWWLRWLPRQSCQSVPKDLYRAYVKEEWPPRNPILLGRASTQYEMKLASKGLIYGDWRQALLLTPVEDLSIAWIGGKRFDSFGPLVEQIIVQPPSKKEHNAADRMHHDTDIYACPMCEGHYGDSIIRQVREIRGECEYCGGTGWVGECKELSADGCPICTVPGGCGGSGFAPGLPLLLIEGDETWQEELRP